MARARTPLHDPRRITGKVRGIDDPEIVHQLDEIGELAAARQVTSEQLVR